MKRIVDENSFRARIPEPGTAKPLAPFAVDHFEDRKIKIDEEIGKIKNSTLIEQLKPYAETKHLGLQRALVERLAVEAKAQHPNTEIKSWLMEHSDPKVVEKFLTEILTQSKGKEFFNSQVIETLMLSSIRFSPKLHGPFSKVAKIIDILSPLVFTHSIATYNIYSTLSKLAHNDSDLDGEKQYNTIIDLIKSGPGVAFWTLVIGNFVSYIMDWSAKWQAHSRLEPKENDKINYLVLQLGAVLRTTPEKLNTVTLLEALEKFPQNLDPLTKQYLLVRLAQHVKLLIQKNNREFELKQIEEKILKQGDQESIMTLAACRPSPELAQTIVEFANKESSPVRKAEFLFQANTMFHLLGYEPQQALKGIFDAIDLASKITTPEEDKKQAQFLMLAALGTLNAWAITDYANDPTALFDFNIELKQRYLDFVLSLSNNKTDLKELKKKSDKELEDEYGKLFVMLLHENHTKASVN